MFRGNKYERPIGVLFDTKRGQRIAGQLKLTRGDLFGSNVVSITNDEFVHIDSGGSLNGISAEGKVSLLDCVRGGTLDSTRRDGFVIHHGDVSFRYALFGKRHVSMDETCIRGIQFTLEGAESSVFPNDKFERFGHLHDPDEAVLEAIERTRPDYLEGEFVRGKAMVSYFTGDWDFLPRFDTVLGTVRVGRSMQIDSFGRTMEDMQHIAVDFDDPATLEGAWTKMREIRQFFGWMMGYAPGWKDVSIFTSEADEHGFRKDAGSQIEVFAPNEWKEVPEGARQRGALIDASQHPDHFMKVMAKWLQRNADARRKSANARFFGCFPGVSNRFVEDGIVSAANTFDLLPDEDKPEVEPLPEAVLDVLKDASKNVRCCMPAGAQREDVLNALGLIRRNKRLRHIVEHRAEIVLNRFGQDKLRQLEKVIGLAVKCRHYYTHGPGDSDPGDVDYVDVKVVHFLTETLEFIYGVSELLLCGWDPSKSVIYEWHPLTGYVESHNAKCRIVLSPE